VLLACVSITVVTSQIIEINSTLQVTVNKDKSAVCARTHVALFTVTTQFDGVQATSIVTPLVSADNNSAAVNAVVKSEASNIESPLSAVH
jgi:hypothetical protein